MSFPILSLMLAIPAVAAVACLFLSASAARWTALAATLIDLALGVVLWTSFDVGGAQWQFVEYAPVFGRFAWALGIGRLGAAFGSLLVGALLVRLHPSLAILALALPVVPLMLLIRALDRRTRRDASPPRPSLSHPSALL